MSSGGQASSYGGQAPSYGGGQSSKGGSGASQGYMPQFSGGSFGGSGGNTFIPQQAQGYRPGFQGQPQGNMYNPGTIPQDGFGSSSLPAGNMYQPPQLTGRSPMQGQQAWQGGMQSGNSFNPGALEDGGGWPPGVGLPGGGNGEGGFAPPRPYNAMPPGGFAGGGDGNFGGMANGIQEMNRWNKPPQSMSPAIGTGGPNQTPTAPPQQPATPTPQMPDANSDQAYQQWFQQHAGQFNGQSQIDLLSQGSFNPQTGAWSGPALPASSFSGSAGMTGDGFTGIRDNVFYRNGKDLIGMLHGWNDPNSAGYADAMKRLRSGGFMANMPGPASFGAPAAAAPPPAATRPQPPVGPPGTTAYVPPNGNGAGARGLPQYPPGYRPSSRNNPFAFQS